MRDSAERRTGLGDFLFGQMRDAMADIRGKLVDEGWFGRHAREHAGGGDLGQQWSKPTVHDRPGDLPTRSENLGWGRRPSFEEQWAVRAPGEQGHETPSPDRDLGVER